VSPMIKPQRMRIVTPAVLALGSNLGDRAATIRAAVGDLAAEPGIDVTAVSGLYETPALKVGGVDASAPRYLNAVALVRTSLTPLDLLDAVGRIEQGHGRVRAERWGDRTLDIDIVDMNRLEYVDDRLTLPHPRAAERAFVLVPWLEVDPAAVLVGRGPVAELARRAGDEVVPYSEGAR
jgi:2-amino-4-hydroxy-6-hydroxymethyldihydropteridine diphosphokinase